jgi:hypothetical protein
MNDQLQEARKLRDLVFGKPITDHEWIICGDNRLRDIAWLRQQVDKKFHQFKIP